MRLQDIMTADVATVAPGDTLQQARTLMRLRGIHHLVVTDGRTPVGILTDDMLHRGESDRAAFVQDVMYRDPVTAAPGMTVREAASLLRGHAMTVLPLVDRRNCLVGIVTVSDFLDLMEKGTVRPVPKGTRWASRHRGTKSKAADAGQ
jgi:CBS domain-containing protein